MNTIDTRDLQERLEELEEERAAAIEAAERAALAATLQHLQPCRDMARGVLVTVTTRDGCAVCRYWKLGEKARGHKYEYQTATSATTPANLDTLQWQRARLPRPLDQIAPADARLYQANATPAPAAPKPAAKPQGEPIKYTDTPTSSADDSPESWAREYVAQLARRYPQRATKLNGSLKFQLSQLPKARSVAQWQKSARGAFDAKVK